MTNGLLLWVDDEIELLKAHIFFLEKKGYEVVTVSNGTDAIDLCRQKTFDLILLDEMMPGISGLQTLQVIKEIQPATPVVMVTKSEEENIMDQAIGSKIADYLIFMDISMQIDNCNSWNDWTEIYKKLVRWELELSSTDSSMTEMLRMQKEEANNGFTKFVKKNYMEWMENRGKQQTSQAPIISPDLFKTYIFPRLDKGEKVFLIVIDNFRYDQWRILSQEIGDQFDIVGG